MTTSSDRRARFVMIFFCILCCFLREASAASARKTKTMHTEVTTNGDVLMRHNKLVTGARAVDVAGAHPSLMQKRRHSKKHENVIFYYVVMGDVASSSLMKTMVTSLRAKGEFTGPVVMVTDRLKCLVQTLGRELLGDVTTQRERENETAVVFDGAHGPYHMVVVAPPRTSADKAMGGQFFEQHKGLARVHAARANLPFEVGTIIGIDEDILVAKPIASFLEHVEDVKRSEIQFNDQTEIAVFRDFGLAQAQFHTGLIVSYPGSEECMKQWVQSDIRLLKGSAVPEASFLTGSLLDVQAGRKTSGTEEGTGQDAFSMTECAKSSRVQHLSDQFLSFPTEESIKESPTTTFVHFTNTYRMKTIFGTNESRLKVQDFIRNKVGLDSDIMSNDKCFDKQKSDEGAGTDDVGAAEQM